MRPTRSGTASSVSWRRSMCRSTRIPARPGLLHQPPGVGQGELGQLADRGLQDPTTSCRSWRAWWAFSPITLAAPAISSAGGVRPELERPGVHTPTGG